MTDDGNDYLRRAFSGDLDVRAISDDEAWPVRFVSRDDPDRPSQQLARPHRSPVVPRPAPRSLRPADVSERALPPVPVTLVDVLREGPVDPVIAVTVPERAYLLESRANAELWVKEAGEVRQRLAGGQPVAPPQLARLLLEAVPVVERYLDMRQ